MSKAYLCDPEKNTKCKKTNCAHNPNAQHHECRLTTKAECAKTDESGKPVVVPPYGDDA